MEIYGKAVAVIQEGSTDDEKFGPNGGFTAVLSDASEDRDFEELKRHEWIEPLPLKCTLDEDHGMKVADTIGSFRPYWDGDTLMMDAQFASTVKAQEARTLVNEGHIFNVSVAFLKHKNKKAEGEPFREILNAGLVGVPSNRNAVITASKAAHVLVDALTEDGEGEVPEDVKEAVLSILKAPKPKRDGDNEDDEDRRENDDDETDSKAPKPYGDVRYADPEEGKYPIDTVAHIRAALAYIGMPRNRAALGSHLAHVEAAIHAAARAHGINVAADSGKSVEDAETKDAPKGVFLPIIPVLDEKALENVLAQVVIKAGATASGVGTAGALVQAIHDASSHLGAACPVMEPDVDNDSGASSGANKGADDFEERLDVLLKAPAEAAAASEEDPAPAEDAAVKKTNKRNRTLGLMQMSVSQ